MSQDAEAEREVDRAAHRDGSERDAQAAQVRETAGCEGGGGAAGQARVHLIGATVGHVGRRSAGAGGVLTG